MKLKYNWDEFPRIKLLLKKIYENTKIALMEENCELDYALEFIDAIEDFVNYFKIYNYDLDRVVSSLEEIEYIAFQKPFYIENNKFLEPDYKKMPPVMNLGSKILLNFSLDGDYRLTDKERRRLYLYHGLSHSIFKFKNETTLNFSKLYSESNFLNTKQIEITVNNGWLLLEEALSQVLAEKITYNVLQKKHPGFRPGLDNFDIELIHSNLVDSDLEIYRIFQPILFSFGMTLSNVNFSTYYSRATITYSLLKKAINGNFSKEVISQYVENNKEFELYQLLYYMGLILNEKYATYGFRPIPKLKLTTSEIDKVYVGISKLLSSLITVDDTKYNKDVKLYQRKLEHKKQEQLFIFYGE